MVGAGGRAALSVVVPSFQHEAFVEEAVRSALEQTLPPDEVIVVDDGSTDASLEILRGIRDPRLRVESQDNHGAHHALNRAIDLSRGAYVAILNSDDVFELARLEHAWGVARSTGAALVCGEVRVIGEDGGDPPTEHDVVRWNRGARELGRAAPSFAAALRRENVAVTTSNVFVHRVLWEALGGFRAYRWVHDYDFLLRAVALCSERAVYEPSLRDVRYRVHGSNTISESLERSLAERAAMLRDVRGLRARVRDGVRRWRDSGALGRAVDAAPLPAPVRDFAPARVPAAVGDAPAASPRPGDSATTGSARVDEARGPLRVGLVVRSLGSGGLEEVVALLARTLPALGVRTAVHFLDAAGAVADRLAEAGVPVLTGDGTADSCLAWVTRGGFDVVSTHFVPAALVRHLDRHGVPVVETLHNTFAWFGEPEWKEERERARSATAVIAVSETAADYWALRTGRRPDAVVPNAVHPGRIAAVPRAFARGRLGLEVRAAPVFAALGRITRQKNPGGLLRAFAEVHREVPSARLVLAGEPDATVPLRHLRRVAPEAFGSDAVRWLGARRGPATVLSAADAYVSNAFYEGWSVAASEAAWLGLPLILCDAGSAAELIGVEREGYAAASRADVLAGPRGLLVPNPCGDPLSVTAEHVEAPDPDSASRNERALAQAMLAVAGALDVWSARAGAIRSYARERLVPSEMARRYAGVFRSALVGSPAGRGDGDV